MDRKLDPGSALLLAAPSGARRRWYDDPEALGFSALPASARLANATSIWTLLMATYRSNYNSGGGRYSAILESASNSSREEPVR
jgi:hypothetical protein